MQRHGPVLFLVLRALIPGLAPAGRSILDGPGRAAADAGHAVGAAAAPDGRPVPQPEVAQRAGVFTLAAADAGVGNREGLGPDDKPVERGVDNAGS